MNSKRNSGVELESPFLDEQMPGTGSIPDVTERLESGEDEGTFTEEEDAESEDAPLDELEADEPAETETEWEGETDAAESEDQEPQVNEACEEELESDEGAEAEWEDREDTADLATESETDLLDSEVWSGTADQLAFRDRVLAAHIGRSRAARGAPQRDLRRDELTAIAGTDIETLPATAAAAGLLLGAATADLAAAQKAGDADARRTIRLTVTSGYRGSGYQRDLWQRYFSAQGGYYDRTQTARQAIPEGRHSDEAIAYLLKRKKAGGFGLGGRIAAPGYSNHQGGIAVDFFQVRTKRNYIANKSDDASRRRWRNTWFHRWLKTHAATYGFMPISTEEWHWEYRPTAAAVSRGQGAESRSSVSSSRELWTAEQGEAAAGGQITYVGEAADEEAEAQAIDESLVQEAPAAIRIQGRILWPALGFPAVIAPAAGSRRVASLLVDATRCITVLVLSDNPSLSKADAAQYLRIVPWQERGRRYIPAGAAGSFREEQLVIHKVTIDSNREVVSFGGGSETDSVVVHLPAFVREQYAKARMTFLYEIRLSEEASARLAGTGEMSLFHVFWNNHRAGEDVPSDEMALLLKSVAPANREKDAKVWVDSAPAPQLRAQWRQKWDRLLPGLLREYEYGVLSEAERQGSKPSKPRAEILHPVFVMKKPPRPLRIAHVTDLHVDVRWDILEDKLKSVAPQMQFNNCNRSSLAIYADATRDGKVDVVLMTGDLIDYGRGHRGLAGGGKLGQNEDYVRDRNWFLFQELLASGDRYTRPVYTSLGNHDWRVNPYPLFAPGAPNPRELVHNFAAFKEKQLAEWIRKSHGDNHDAKYSYDPRWKNLDLRDVVKALGKAITSSETLEDKGLPTETSIDSVAWYLLTINPFLDYRCELPGGYRLLMLDFGKRESLLIYDTRLGKNYGYVLPGAGQSRGPRALSCLTKTQQWMVSQFLQLSGKAKVIGLHTPPLGPYPNWSELDLVRGFKTYGKPLEARGPLTYQFEPADGGKALKGHPLFAIRPDGGPYGMDAEYGSFRSARSEFIKDLAKPSAGVQVVFSGHIHRDDLLAVCVPSEAGKGNLKGQYLVKSVRGAYPVKPGKEHPPLVYPGVAVDPRRLKDGRAPLYINTTSAGPLGNARQTEDAAPEDRFAAPGYAYVELVPSGVIERVAFRFPVPAQTKPGQDAWELHARESVRS